MRSPSPYFLLAMLWLFCSSTSGAAQDAPAPVARPIILAGTVLAPDGPIERGFVLIEQGRISSVSTALPRRPGATIIHTHGVIAPGFIDLHNHISFNALPRWNPSARFDDKYQWRLDADYQRSVATPYSHVVNANFCDMNRWGELRALAGGTTSMLATGPDACIGGLVRNLDHDSGLYGAPGLERVFNTLELPPASEPAFRAYFAAQAQLLAASTAFDALVVHLAEGVDAVAHEEFAFMKAQSLLHPKGVFIHGTALDTADFRDMAAAGTGLVWSPRSNIELYGQTTDVRAALDAGVQVALAPDWGITGSSNILDELGFARTYNERQLGGRLNDRQLVDMVTRVPAQIAGLDHELGALRIGLRADLVVIGRHGERNPYRAVTTASASDVKLVLIEGVPLYGARGAMRRFWTAPQLQDFPLPRAAKRLATPAAAGTDIADIAARLTPALRAEGTALAPLVEPASAAIDDRTFEDDDACDRE